MDAAQLSSHWAQLIATLTEPQPGRHPIHDYRCNAIPVGEFPKAPARIRDAWAARHSELAEAAGMRLSAGLATATGTDTVGMPLSYPAVMAPSSAPTGSMTERSNEP
jgi:hypothetical protein